VWDVWDPLRSRVRAGLRRTVRSIARNDSICVQQERISGINDCIAVALIRSSRQSPEYVARPRLNSSDEVASGSLPG
jgi:hypothetical protein